jgi:histidinol-phosphate aminotransferase
MNSLTDAASRFIRPEIAAMEPYHPIVPFDVLSARLGIPERDLVKLDANENPYGPSPRALAALAEGSHYHIYPDPEATALRQLLAAHTGLPVARLLAGMGADELIDLILRVVLTPGDVVIDCPPTFGMYPFSTVVNGGRYIAVPRDEAFGLDVAGIEQAVAAEPDAKILFLCSPNNPDGSLIDDETLARLLRLPLLVVLDEAYIDFAGQPSRMDWALRHENLAVIRTFSKQAGLAGLRLGYGIFPAWLLPQLWKIKQPYNVNVAAGLAGLAALEDQAWLAEVTEKLVSERERLLAALGTIPYLEPYPSQANFILCRLRQGDAAQLKTDLAQQGILVRYFNKPGLSNCIRISVGRPDQTERLLTALRGWQPVTGDPS